MCAASISASKPSTHQVILISRKSRGRLKRLENAIQELGEASAGKSQACLQLLVCCQWPVDEGGLLGKAMYMYTEGDPSMKRLLAVMSASPFQATPDNIYWERDFEDGEDLLERLQGIEVIMRQPQGLPLRLLVIDSIAHLFRDVGDRPDTSAYVHRTGMLFRISALLRRFADTYNIAVVVTNQVSDAFTDDDILTKKQAPACKHTGGLRLLSSGRELVPALGLAWANCVNTRLFLSRTEVIVASPQCHSNSAAFCGPEHIPYSVSLRYMQVVFSPCLPPDTCLFVVTQHGLQGVDNSKITQERQDHTHRYVDRQMARHPLAAQQPGLQPPGVGGDAMPQNIAEAVHLHQQGATLATGVFAAKSLSKPCGLSHAKFKLVKTIHQ